MGKASTRNNGATASHQLTGIWYAGAWLVVGKLTNFLGEDVTVKSIDTDPTVQHDLTLQHALRIAVTLESGVRFTITENQCLLRWEATGQPKGQRAKRPARTVEKTCA